MYKFKYNTLEERKRIEEENKNLYLIEDSDLNDGKYLVYTNEKPYIEPTWEEEMEKKISTLEAENKKLNEITKEQDQLLVDNAYALKVLEMNIGGMQRV